MCWRESRGCHGEHTCDASRVPALAADVALAQRRLRLALAASTRLPEAHQICREALGRVGQHRTFSQRHSSRHCTCLRREHWTKRLQRSQHCGGMLRAGTRRRGFHGAYQGHLKLRSRPGLLAWVLPYGLLFFLRLPCEHQRHHVHHSKAPSANAAELRRVRERRQRGRASGEWVSGTGATAERGGP
jgi:hypothetical protein